MLMGIHGEVQRRNCRDGPLQSRSTSSRVKTNALRFRIHILFRFRGPSGTFDSMSTVFTSCFPIPLSFLFVFSTFPFFLPLSFFAFSFLFLLYCFSFLLLFTLLFVLCLDICVCVSVCEAWCLLVVGRAGVGVMEWAVVLGQALLTCCIDPVCACEPTNFPPLEGKLGGGALVCCCIAITSPSADDATASLVITPSCLRSDSVCCICTLCVCLFPSKTAPCTVAREEECAWLASRI